MNNCFAFKVLVEVWFSFYFCHIPHILEDVLIDCVISIYVHLTELWPLLC